MNDIKNKIKHFDAFSGFGGFTIACERNGIETIGFSEIDRYANSVLKYHWPDIKNYGDITKIDIKALPDFDLLTGGFPCQSHSIAGNRKGFEDPRGQLFFNLLEILKIKKPRWFLFENVFSMSRENRIEITRAVFDFPKEDWECIDDSVLKIKEFEEITSKSCHYCNGFSLERNPKSRGNGIDRKDSEVGYEINNCVPCCATCNFVKNNMGYQDFIKYIKQVYTTIKNYEV